ERRVGDGARLRVARSPDRGVPRVRCLPEGDRGVEMSLVIDSYDGSGGVGDVIASGERAQSIHWSRQQALMCLMPVGSAGVHGPEFEHQQALMRWVRVGSAG